jgi:putative sterol carrier protein
MADRVATNPGMVQQVRASFQFKLAGENGGEWFVNLKDGAGAVRAGEIPDADCTIYMSDADFVLMAQGKLNAMAAFGMGRIKVEGNPMLATKLQSLLA